MNLTGDISYYNHSSALCHGIGSKENIVLGRRVSRLLFEIPALRRHLERESKTFEAVPRVEHGQECPEAEWPTLIIARAEDYLLASLGGGVFARLTEAVRAHGIGPEHQEADWDHLDASEHAGDSHVDVRVCQLGCRVQVAGAFQDPEDDLEESENG